MVSTYALKYRQYISRNTFLFPLVLLVLVLIANYSVQPNMFTPRVLNANLRSFMPLIFLAVSQTLVILSGSIDLSVGTMMSLSAAFMVTRLSNDASASAFWPVLAQGIGIGLIAGAVNGICVSFIRLPAFVTTYATSYVFAGVALWVLPRPGGFLPAELVRSYRGSIPFNIPLGIYIILGLLLLWTIVRRTRYGYFLYAIGGNERSAFTSGVPVNWHRFFTHMLAGGIAGVAALFLILNTGSSDARIGNSMTLDSIVAVVLGGTAMSGGIGGIAGSIMGVLALGFIRNIVSFANVFTWYQPLVDASIILLALLSPGFGALVRSQVQQFKSGKT